MSKNPNSRSKPVKQSEPMNGAMKFFLAGCVAELYLLIVRRFYINGSAVQQIAWYDQYLKLLVGAGAAVLVLGVILSVLFRADKKKRVIGWSVTGAGAFLAISTALIWWLNGTAMTLLCVLVPAAMLMGILWSLYDRECALSLTVLGSSLIVLWICRKAITNIYLGTYVKIGAAVFLVLLAALAILAHQKKLTRLLSEKADPKPIYVSCGLSAVAVALAFVNSSLAFYAMWVLAIVVFALAVYYTVKQL